MVNSDQDRGGTSYDDDTQERGSLSSAVNDQFAIRSRRKGAPNTNQTGVSNGNGYHSNSKSQQQQYAPLPSSLSNLSSATSMLHTSIDGGFDEACTNDDEYYFDGTNYQSWACSFGTGEEDGIWMVRNDPPGQIMSLAAYSGITISLLATYGRLSHTLANIYCTICAMALACHAKTMFTGQLT
ncbi:hypothetical protein ACHAXN_009191 [Cyclotella atomus]